MEHLVRFTTTEGREAQHVAPTLEDALRFVERLRNNGEASVVRVFRLNEVPIAFKTYYRAELRTPDAVEEHSPAAAGPAPVDGPAVTQAPDGDAGRKLFSRT